MVHPGRFELPTARFVAEYSIQLSYGCKVCLLQILFDAGKAEIKNGAPRKIRTSDRSVRSRVLYPAELWVHFDSYCRFYPTIFPYYISVSFCPSRSFDCKSTYALESMVHPGRFELPTARFVAEYSIQLSYGCILNGGEAGIRTPDAAFDRILP